MSVHTIVNRVIKNFLTNLDDKMVGWHLRLDGHGFAWALGVGDRQGGLACCGSWGRKELDMTE